MNGVSRLHGAVSRRLFESLFPRWPEAEVPVRHVTNGVHVPTWDSAEADALWAKACGEERWRGSLEYVEEQIRCVKDDELWQLRSTGRRSLVEFARRRLALQRAAQGAPQYEVDEAAHAFDEKRLTFGFGRRFATYKRPDMLLHDPERLIRILTNPDRPAQLIIAGKAHPQDWAGQAIIRRWNEFLRRPEVQGHAAFLSDYDMLMTQRLIEGVDVWINTPRRPWEASGTSGMKVLVNGGLNLSELDGWWAEAYSPDVGWAIGDGRDRGDDVGWDAAEANVLYALLEQEIIPAFYDRDQHGIPTHWVAKIRESMARLTPMFSTNRTVRQYAEEYYIPLAQAYCLRAAEAGNAAADLLAWQRNIAAHWQTLRFKSIDIEDLNDGYVFRVQVHLGYLKPEDVQVEVYADPLNSEGPFRKLMSLVRVVPNSPGMYEYACVVPRNRPAHYYTPRIIPSKKGVFIPLELPFIIWQK